MSIVFLAFQSTGIGPASRPIEVAICNELGAVEAFLIRPEPSWVHWDDISEYFHGIMRDQLIQFGLDARHVADRVFGLLSQADSIYSEAPIHESKWLEALMYVGGHPANSFLVREIGDLCVKECEPVRSRGGRMAAYQLIREAKTAVRKRCGLHYRAGPDAKFLCLAWQEIRRLVELSGP
jgi:hypothetical protein